MESNLIPTLLLLSIFIFQLQNTFSQRISAKKCEEYTNMYREEYKDVITGNAEYGELKCPKFVADATIVGGRDAFPNEFPSTASLLTKDSEGNLFATCGGVLISDEFVLTAAHCLTKKHPAKISIGEIDLAPNKFSSKRRDLDVERVIIHPDYKPPSSYNDIALIKLAKKLPLTFEVRPSFRPACLVYNEIPAGTKAIAAGWGRTSAFGETSNILQVVELPVAQRDVCSDFFRDALDFKDKFPGVNDKENWLIPETNMCAGEDGKDTCQGDSGGPLYVTGNSKLHCVHYLAGITSFGSSHCGSATPGVYTKVSAYLDWIETQVWS